MTQYYLNPKFPNPGLIAAKEGRSFCGYVNAKTGIDSETVLTDSGFLLELQSGRRYVIGCFYMYLSTVSDWATAEWGVAANPDGSGTFTAKSVRFRIDTGNVQTGSMPSLTRMDPPMVFTIADGRAFTAQVQGNDAAAPLTLGFNGWWETDTGAN